MMDSNSCIEPSVVYPEELFEGDLCNVIQATLKHGSLTWTAPKFGLDISAEVRHSAAAAVTHIEIEAKSYGGQRAGGVGFGTAKGGPQVEILLDNASLPQVRWAFADDTRPYGTARYALLTCDEARRVAMGVVKIGKQNNFSISKIKPYWAEWPMFCENLRSFLHQA